GCEGGWTEAEIAQAIAHGFQSVSLGNRILRAITAPIVACTLVVAALEQSGS
ncbi:MAG: RsmE family RNA methyltransferase, partial [Cyanobacteria bacterium J06638_38]